MPEINRIIAQINAGFKGEAWHGPSVLELLKGVTAEQAARWRVGNSHTCWEIVLHIVCWKDTARRRISGERYVPTDEENFPAVTDTSDAAWKKTLAKLKKSHKLLVDAAEKLSDRQLDKPFPTQRATPYQILHGVVQHDIYHAGQIALMRKLG